MVTIGRIVNAFFRWEFNSCETLVAGAEVYPIDYANACPDVAITSLHYYFPWAMKALVQVVGLLHRRPTGRPTPHVDPAPWFDDRRPATTSPTTRSSRAYRRAGRRSYFDTERYRDFCASRLAGIWTRSALEYFESPEFDRVLVETVTSTFPPHEHDQFIAHFRGLLAAWCRDERARLG